MEKDNIKTENWWKLQIFPNLISSLTSPMKDNIFSSQRKVETYLNDKN